MFSGMSPSSVSAGASSSALPGVQADEHAAGFDDFEAPYLQILGPDGGPGQL